MNNKCSALVLIQWTFEYCNSHLDTVFDFFRSVAQQQLVLTPGCDNSRFLVVPDWYANEYCCVPDWLKLKTQGVS